MIALDLHLGKESSLNRPGLVLFAWTMLLGLMATSEIIAFNPKSNVGVKSWAVYLGTALVIVMGFWTTLDPSYPSDCTIGRMGWPMFGMAAVVGLAFVSQMIGYKQGDLVVDNVARTVFIVAYIGLLLSFWAPLRLSIGNEWGMVAIISLVATVKMSDSGAYTIGKMFGKNKLAPNLSPGKTIEGVAGGMLGGCIGAFVVFYVVAPWMTGSETAAPWWLIVIFAIVVTAVGIVGDLSESLLKREGGVKNSSKWLPGLGGVMDIIDSLLAAGPVVFAFWASGRFGPAS